MATSVFLISGMEVVNGVGGHQSYVRTFARAATALGFDTHIFVVGPGEHAQITDYGTVHRARPASVPLRNSLASFHGVPLARAIVTSAEAAGGPVLLHGFGRGGCAAMLAERKLAARGIATVRVQSSYMVSLDEARTKLEGARSYAATDKRISLLRDCWETRLLFARIEKAVHRRAARVLVNYRSVERLLKAYYGVDLTCCLIPYTIESALMGHRHDIVSRSPAPSHIPSVLMLSRHDPRKGIDVLLHALAKLRQEGARFRATLAGTGLLFNANRAIVAKLGLGDCVAMPGYVERPEELHRSHDVFVLPSLREHSGSIGLLEAMQAGMTCVASSCDGIPEDITDGEDGLLVPPGDVQALADALARVLIDSELRKRLALGARARFKRQFAGAAFTARLGEIYAELGFFPRAAIRGRLRVGVNGLTTLSTGDTACPRP